MAQALVLAAELAEGLAADAAEAEALVVVEALDPCSGSILPLQ
ncbi:hypothetical protein ACMZ7W_03395 [Gardnerella vaginalis]